jgi:argininosuccinate lyase
MLTSIRRRASATIKSLPNACNEDLQGSVAPLLDCVKTSFHSLSITLGALITPNINAKRINDALTADMLVMMSQITWS